MFSRKEKDSIINWIFLLFLSSLFLIGFIFKNCIFEWPLRFDFMTCVKEQWRPAVQEAIEFPSPSK